MHIDYELYNYMVIMV